MRRLAFVVVLAGVGCTLEGEGNDGNLYQGEGEEQPDSTSAQVTSGPATVATTSGAGGSPTSTTAPATSGAGGADDEGCSPEMDDSPCIDCLKQQCCSEIEACTQDGGCACWADCLEDGDFTDCALCGVPNDLLDQLLLCAEGCQLECGA